MNWFSRAFARLTKRDLAANVIGWQYRDHRQGSSVRVTPDSALRHSAVWACLRLRADMVSSLPIDVFRYVAGAQVELPKPQWLVQPFEDWQFGEWRWGAQFDMDRAGNSIGIIKQFDSAGRMAAVEPVGIYDVSILVKGRQIVEYRVCGEKIDPTYIWHERQYRVAGSPIGLSPVEHAAWSIGGYLSAQQFALDWYENGASPAGVLKNTVLPEVPQETAEAAKAKFKAATLERDLFVTGKNWEWNAQKADASSVAFLDEMKYGVTDVCRFFSVPADMIDAPSDGSNITYANVTQRNVQLLVVNLQPTIERSEEKLTSALNAFNTPARFVKFNTDSILRMDPLTRAQVSEIGVKSRVLLPSEWRALDNRRPYTEADYAEFERLFGPPAMRPDSNTTQHLSKPDFVPPLAIGWHLPRELESGRD